jgi:hypothetical protein
MPTDPLSRPLVEIARDFCLNRAEPAFGHL